MFGPGGGLYGRFPIIAWALTTMFGVLVFAVVVRRPERETDSPLAAVLSLLATARSGRRELVGPSSAALVQTSALAAPARRAAPAGPVAPDGPHNDALAGNRPADGQARPPLRFDKKPGRGAVRRQITYRLIRLSEGQDELRSREIMRLDRGDEVEIIDQEGRSMQVRTPTGVIGWIPTDSTS